jgi:hypothetical protein
MSSYGQSEILYEQRGIWNKRMYNAPGRVRFALKGNGLRNDRAYLRVTQPEAPFELQSLRSLLPTYRNSIST